MSIFFHESMLGTSNDVVKHDKHVLRHSCGMSLQERINFLFDEYKKNVDPEFTRAEFARRVDVSRATVTTWMNGETQTINGEKAHNVARVFNANAEYVQTGKGPKYRPAGKSEAEKAIEKVIRLATASIDARRPAMSRDDRIKAISLCLMHYSLNSAISDAELEALVDKFLPL